MSPGFVSSRTALLRGLGAMLGAAALAAGAIRMSAERWAGAGAAELEPWASAGLCGALVATLGAALAWPVLRRAERLSADLPFHLVPSCRPKHCTLEVYAAALHQSVAPRIM